MDQNPESTVKIVVHPFTEHYQKIGTSLASDSSEFDVFVFDAALLGQSYPKLLPLSDLFETDAAWRDYYHDGVPAAYRGSWNWDGVPLRRRPRRQRMMAWWRTDIFERERPSRADDIRDHARATPSPRRAERR